MIDMSAKLLSKQQVLNAVNKLFLHVSDVSPPLTSRQEAEYFHEPRLNVVIPTVSTLRVKIAA